MKLARAWLGVISGILMVAAAAWLLGVYIHSRVVLPREKVLVDTLKEKARTDTEIQKVLQPELDRQHLAAAARRKGYRAGGIILVIAAAVFVGWSRWLRPQQRREPSLETKKTGPSLPEPASPSHVPRAETAGPDLAPIDEIIKAEGSRPHSAIPILQAIQSRYRYLPDEALRRVCRTTEITPAQIAGVASFYGQFRQSPVGEHIIRVCEGTACHVSGAVEVGIELRRRLGITNGTDTDPSRRYTIERVACVGSCSLAPVIMIDEKIYGHLSALSAGRVLRDFATAGIAAGNASGNHRDCNGKNRKREITRNGHIEIRIGLGSCGVASGAQEVHAALETELELAGAGVLVKPVGCSGLCHSEPLVEVVEGGRSALYGNVRPEHVRKLVRKHVKPHGLIRRVREEIKEGRTRLREDAAWVPIAEREVDARPYLGKQVRVVLENCGVVAPLSLEEYRVRGGMRALEECLKRLLPDEVIGKLRASGIRGRGGAGFPTAVKWDLTRRAPGTKKYVICNGDEGDPGAFMDRAVLEADPFRVIEGLVIAAYAIGADEGIAYVRREYPIAVRHMRAAIQKAEEAGFLGDRILGGKFGFRLQVREGAGAFVCGEETALIQSIEGQRGMPRMRPPYPAQSGLWGKPTLINNVETLACVPWIIRNGPEAFASLGTEKSKGTKVFSLAGKVNRGGLIEVPMGITIREIVEEIGGGIKAGRSFKAVLIGGPSGGCIPARLAETRIDFEELASTGAIMGSGGLVVLDDGDCAVEIARYFLQFTQSESCGKCTYCRVGTKRMLEILERICAGKGREGDIATLEELGARVKKGSLCGLGQTAPNPVLTTLRYFREEYEAHIRERRCPAAQCKALSHYRVLESCTGCTLCAQACPAGAITPRPYLRHEIVDELCTRCGMCLTACPESSIEVAS
jgi:NADH-quinone oxidoreductase subunit F